jgi:hypothetical protein
VAGAAALLVVEEVEPEPELDVVLPPVEVPVVVVVVDDVVVAAAAGAVVTAVVVLTVVVLGAPEPPQAPRAVPATSAQTSNMFGLRVMRPRAQI